MSVVSRGVKNAFRNWLRTLAVVAILAIGIGLSLSMLVANEAVNAKITDLKTKVGTTLTINPAGSQGFEGGGEPLKMADVATVGKIDHVATVSATSNFRLRNQDATTDTNMRFGSGNGGQEAGTTNLQSAIDAGTLGRRNNSQGTSVNFSLPVAGIGSNGTDQTGAALKITSGRNITAADTGYVAVVGQELATKNSLAVNSTFTAYNQTFTVVGIFDQGTKFQNAGLAIPLAVAQTLTGNTNEVSDIVATIDSAENVAAAQTAIKNALGGGRADVTSTEQTVQTAIDSLKGVQQISIIAFVGALVAAAVIIFLVMLMIVRERKREIGVLKAIGGSNKTIMAQFIVESLVLVAMGTVVGLGISLISSNGIANALVSSNTPAAGSSPVQQGGRMRSGFRNIQLQAGGNSLQTTSQLVGQVAANVGWVTVLYGLLAAIAIAVVGSAVPAWLIAKVRPAEVMRGE
jgi:putative ABC transport system permease protein